MRGEPLRTLLSPPRDPPRSDGGSTALVPRFTGHCPCRGRRRFRRPPAHDVCTPEIEALLTHARTSSAPAQRALRRGGERPLRSEPCDVRIELWYPGWQLFPSLPSAPRWEQDRERRRGDQPHPSGSLFLVHDDPRFTSEARHSGRWLSSSSCDEMPSAAHLCECIATRIHDVRRVQRVMCPALAPRRTAKHCGTLGYSGERNRWSTTLSAQNL